MAETFQAETPPATGWYFCTDNPEDPSSTQLGWWDAERLVFTTFDAATPAILKSRPWVDEWHWENGSWEDRASGGSWRGPQQWHGPIEASFPTPANT